jgi:hypothetical protein
MGTNPAYRPKLLAEKLRYIRVHIFNEISYPDMVRLLDCKTSKIRHNSIYYYEQGKRIPTLDVLLCYAHRTGISINNLVDDNVPIEYMVPPFLV